MTAAPGERRSTGAAVPRNLRRPGTIAVAVAALALLGLALAHLGSSRADVFDRAVDADTRALWARPGPLAYALDGLIAPVPIMCVALASAGLGLLLRLRRVALVALLAPVTAFGTTSVLKPLVGRTIHGPNLSFPSGHAAAATSIGIVAGLLVVGRLRPGRLVGTALLVLLAGGCGAVMALDQVVLDAHYPSDTVGGICTAIAVVGALALVADPVLDQRAVRRGSGAPPAHQRSATRGAISRS